MSLNDNLEWNFVSGTREVFEEGIIVDFIQQSILLGIVFNSYCFMGVVLLVLIGEALALIVAYDLSYFNILGDLL